MKLLSLLLAAAGAALALATTPARAELSQDHSVGTHGQHCCWDTAVFIDNQSGPGDLQASLWFAHAQVSGSVTQGHASGSITADADRPDGFVYSHGGGHLRDIWGDSFGIGSSTLAAGTPVQVQVTVLLEASLQSQAPGDAVTRARAIAALHFSGPDAPWITGAVLDSGWSDVATVGSTGGTATGQATFASAVGAGFSLYGDFVLDALATSGSAWRSSVQAAALGSARFYIDVLTPGASLVSASGSTYATPVPEPGAWALLLAGLALLVLRRGGGEMHG